MSQSSSRKALDSQVTESQVLKACLDYLSRRGIFHWRANQIPVPLPGGGFRRFSGLRGVSDIIAILGPRGTACCIEVKRPGAKLRPEQTEFLQRVTDLGGIAMTVHSVEELEADLNEALAQATQLVTIEPGDAETPIA